MALLLSQIKEQLGLDEGGVPIKHRFINQPNIVLMDPHVHLSAHHGLPHDCKRCAHLNDNGKDHGKEWAKLMRGTGGRGPGKNYEEVQFEEVTDDELNDIYDGVLITEEEHDVHGAHDLVLHADNDSHLYHSSHVPVAKNLEKKFKKGIYDKDKAKKLWKYHADRAAQSYHKAHGNPQSHWKHHFSPSTRRAAAEHWEKHHRTEMELGNFHDH